jgi:hypothetical protein
LRRIHVQQVRHGSQVATLEVGTAGPGAGFAVRAAWDHLPVVVLVEGIGRELDATTLVERVAAMGGLEDVLADVFAPGGVPAGARVTVGTNRGIAASRGIAEGASVDSGSPRLARPDAEIRGPAQKTDIAAGDPIEGDSIRAA